MLKSIMRDFSKFIGQSFGRLKVTGFHVEKSKSGNDIPKFECTCICGNTKSVNANNVTGGYVKSCGCIRKETTLKCSKARQKYKIEDFIGKRFGKLVVLGETDSDSRQFISLCDCGVTKYSTAVQIASGAIKSCGCGERDGIVPETTEIFTSKAVKVHGDRYEYRNVDYTYSNVPVSITCKTHGDFQQAPSSHLMGRGCPSCAGYGYRVSKQGSFYILVSGDITKVGITNNSVSSRARQINNSSGRDFKQVFHFTHESGHVANDVETIVLQELRASYKQPVDKFSGSTECFYDVDVTKLVNRVGELLREIGN